MIRTSLSRKCNVVMNAARSSRTSLKHNINMVSMPYLLKKSGFPSQLISRSFNTFSQRNIRTSFSLTTLRSHISTFKAQYDEAALERAKIGIVPKPLDAKGVHDLVELLKNPPEEEKAFLLDLLKNRVPPGVDEAAYVKAAFLTDVAAGKATSPLVSKEDAIHLLGTMQGGYNIVSLIEFLKSPTLGGLAAAALSQTLLVFDSFYDVEALAKAGNVHASTVLNSWANAEWFLNKPEVPKKITVTVFKVLPR